MKPTQLPKGKSQLEIKATLRHRDQVNDTVSVTFDAEPSPDALERYKVWAARILAASATKDRSIKESLTVEDGWRHRCDASDLEDGKPVLGLLKNGRMSIVYCAGSWRHKESDAICFNLSMWRPLPAPPEGWEPLWNENDKDQHCAACGGCGMLPGIKPDDDVMNTPCPSCNPWSKHTNATPPGDTLRETLEAKGISQTLLAETMRRPIKTINEIIHAKARITEQTAIELEHALNIPAHFWMALETNYRLARARLNELTK